VGTFYPLFSCGAIIKVRPAVGSESYAGAIDAALDEWKSAFASTGVALPQFVLRPSSDATAQVSVKVWGSSPTYCGFSPNGTGQIDLRAATSAQCSTVLAHHDDITTTLVHELTHVLGFVGGGGEKLGVSPYSDQCTTYLPANPDDPDDRHINGLVCQHDLEYILGGYGYRSAELPANFWSRHIVTGVALTPASLTLVVNDSAQLVAGNLLFARSGSMNSAPRGAVQVARSAVDQDVAQVSADRVVGVGIGATFVRVNVVPGSLPTTWQLGGLMAQRGDSIPVTVTAASPPPPGGGYRVVAISGASTPIYDAGTYPLSAVVTPSVPSAIRWGITYSNGVRPNVITGYGTSGYSLIVEPGSYNIQIVATPRYGSGSQASPYVYGVPSTFDFPVCTDGEGGGGPIEPSLGSKEPEGGVPVVLPGTEAVEGCA
jgi:hypothetical protein